MKSEQQEQKRGKLIVFEGPDGFGKTTQSGLTFQYLHRKLFTLLPTKEPGSAFSEFCLSMRENLFRERHSHDTLDEVEQGLLLFLDHYHHARLIEKAMENGTIVISDRWCYSQYCYNRVFKEGRIDGTTLYHKYESLQIQPDLVIILGLDKDEAMERLDNRPGDAQKRKSWAPSTKDKEKSDEYLGTLIIAYGELGATLSQDDIWCEFVTPSSEQKPEEVFKTMIRPFIDRLIKGD